MAAYSFSVDRSAGTWTCTNSNGNQIASGQLPLTETKRNLAIFSDHGVSNPVHDAMQAIWEGDWDVSET